MAGDWLKVRHDLPTDPAVIAIAAALDLSEDEVVGKLLRFWIWGDQQTKDGNAPGVTKTFLDRYLGVTGFAAAMQEAGWLDIGNAGISIPNFERHISESAKTRALTSRRVARCKAKKGNAATVTKALPREEKRREEKKNTYRFQPPSVADVRVYCTERRNGIDPQAFVDYYATRGWKLKGGVSMKDWRAAVRTWEKNNAPRTNQQPNRPDGRVH